MDASDQIVVTEHAEVREGKLDELRAAIDDLAGQVAENEPRILAWHAYFSAGGGRVSFMHVHPDMASLDDHLEITVPLDEKLGELIARRAVDIYGEPSAEALARIREQSGGADITVHEWHAGVSRAGAMDLEGAMKAAMDFMGQHEDVLRKLTQK